MPRDDAEVVRAIEPITSGPSGGGIRVVTDAGTIDARVRQRRRRPGGCLGNLPLEARRRHLFVSEPRASSPDWPFAWDDERGYYFRPEGSGPLLCACDARATESGDNATEPPIESMLRDKLERYQPGLLPLRIRDSWAGQRTFAPDGRFVIGWDPRMEGLFWVAALGGHGVTVSPAVGRLAAEAIAKGPGAEVAAGLRALGVGRLLAG